MLSIKLKPIGKKGQISYRIVVAEARSKLKGRFVEDLGWYNPYTNEFKVDEEKTKKWLSSGAQATDSVHNLLVRAGVYPGPKKAVHSTKKKKTEEGSAPEGGGGSAGLPAQAGDAKEKIKEAPTPSDASSEVSESQSPEGVGKEPKEEPKEKESEEKKPDKETPQEEKPKKESDKEKPPEEKKSEENK